MTHYLDTNVLLRLILQDNEPQSKHARSLVEQSQKKELTLFVSTITLFESEWVLRSFYKFDKQDIVQIFQKLLSLSEILFEHSHLLNLTFSLWEKNNLSLEDSYHLAYCKLNGMELETFDKKAQKIFNQIQGENET